MNIIKDESKIVLRKEERNERWYKCVEELHQKVSKIVDLTELGTDILESEVKGPLGNFANNAAEFMINQQNCLKFYQIMLLNWCLQFAGRYGKSSSRQRSEKIIYIPILKKDSVVFNLLNHCVYITC